MVGNDMNESSAFEVPLKPDLDNDYDSIKYLDTNQWSEEDKREIETIVKSICNKTDVKGEEQLETALGSVRITFEQYPSAPRRKKIVGFLTPKNPTFAETITTSDDLSIISNSEENNVENSVHQSLYRVLFRNGTIMEYKATRYIQDGDKYYFYSDNTDISDRIALVSEVIAIN